MIEPLELRVHLYTAGYTPLPIVSNDDRANYTLNGSGQPTIGKYSAVVADTDPNALKNTSRTILQNDLTPDLQNTINTELKRDVNNSTLADQVAGDQLALKIAFDRNLVSETQNLLVTNIAAGTHYFFDPGDLTGKAPFYTVRNDSPLNLSDKINSWVTLTSGMYSTSIATHPYASGSPVQVHSIYKSSVLRDYSSGYVDWTNPVDIQPGTKTLTGDLYDTDINLLQFVQEEAVNYLKNRNSPGVTSAGDNYGAMLRYEMNRQLRSWAWQNPVPNLDPKASTLAAADEDVSWKGTNSSGNLFNGPNWFPFTAAQRLNNLVSAYMMLLNSGFFTDGTTTAAKQTQAELNTLFLMEIYNHCKYLNAVFPTNPGSFKAAPNKAMISVDALLTTARVFSKIFPEARQWLATGTDKLTYWTSRNYYRDFSSKENAFLGYTDPTTHRGAATDDYDLQHQDGLTTEQSTSYAENVTKATIDQYMLAAYNGELESSPKTYTGRVIATSSKPLSVGLRNALISMDSSASDALPLEAKIAAILKLTTPDGHTFEFGDSVRTDQGVNSTYYQLALNYLLGKKVTLRTAPIEEYNFFDFMKAGAGEITAPSAAEVYYTDGSQTYTTRQGEHNLIDQDGILSLHAAGAFVMRAHGETDGGSDNVAMTFKAGPQAFPEDETHGTIGHSQYDMLALDLTGYGRPLIEDPGISSSYHPSLPTRKWAVSAAAQNSVSIASSNPAVTSGYFGYKYLDSDLANVVPVGEGVTGLNYAYASSSGDGPALARTVWTDADSGREAPGQASYLVFDWGIVGAGGKATTFNINFNIPTQKDVVNSSTGKASTPVSFGANTTSVAGGIFTTAYSSSQAGLRGDVFVKSLLASGGPSPRYTTYSTVSTSSKSGIPFATSITTAPLNSTQFRISVGSATSLASVTFIHTSSNGNFNSSHLPSVAVSSRQEDRKNGKLRVTFTIPNPNAMPGDAPSKPFTLIIANPFGNSGFALIPAGQSQLRTPIPGVKDPYN